MRSALAALFAIAVAAPVFGADLCPAPAKPTPPAPGEPKISPDDDRIHVESDGAEMSTTGDAQLKGRVLVRQGTRSLAADSVHYDNEQGELKVAGTVQYEDPRVRIRGDTGNYDAAGGAAFDNATFDLLDRNGRGRAKRIGVTADGQVDLENVRYTTCPAGIEDWHLAATRINIDTAAQQGSGRNVKVAFKRIPIFYTPFISFPVGDARKSGFLFPNIGRSQKNGFNLEVPYYFNLAPNYDLTLTPSIYTARGVDLGAEFRYLTRRSQGVLEANYLPSDKATSADRYRFRIADVSDLRHDLRFDVNAEAVSDVNYFEDFGLGTEATSVTYLERRADLLYEHRAWRIGATLQNFQTLDQAIATTDRPYTRLPRIAALGYWPLGRSAFELGFDGEAVNFTRNAGIEGLRLDAAPELRWVKRGPGYYFEPAAGWRLTQYDLRDQSPGSRSTLSRSLPYARLDTGLIFERLAGTHLQTLEPRMLYSYVPFRDQTALPIFDTSLPDLDLIELFRANRFIGVDRVSDANQLSLGLTSRWVNEATGEQIMSASIGQTRYLRTPRVTLPGETPPAGNASDFIAQMALTAYQRWNVNLDLQWDPSDSSTQRSQISLQYRADASRVVNLSYRYRRGKLEQLDGSLAWPVAQRWSVFARLVYSLQDHSALDQFAGFEYKSCCWRIRLVQRRYVSNRTGERDTSLALQLELTGLSSVGVPADAFLERSIRGYSSRKDNP
jgi:LPS-assembly protein